jgi:putative ABC transport system permease protein
LRQLNLYNLAIQNLRRKPYRTLFIVLSVAVATGSIFVVTLVLRSVQTSLAVGQARLGADLVVVPAGHEVSAQEAFITGQPTTFYMDDQILEQIGELPGVAKTSAQVFVQTLTNAKCCIGEFFLIGFEPETDFTISPWLATHLGEQALGPLQIIVGDRILLRHGDGATFYGTDFEIVGVLEKTGMGIDRSIYVPMVGLRTMIEDSVEKAEQPLMISTHEISSVLIGVAPGMDVLDVAEQIEGTVEGVQVFTTSQLNQAVSRQMGGVLGVILGVTVSLWLMSLVTIGLMFSLIVNERQRELGLLRAMGARRRFVVQLVTSEAGLLTGLGGLAGVTAATILLMSFSRLIQLRLRIPYLLPGLPEVIGLEVALLILALLTGILASLQPALSGSRLEPYAAIRQGE